MTTQYLTIIERSRHENVTKGNKPHLLSRTLDNSSGRLGRSPLTERQTRSVWRKLMLWFIVNWTLNFTRHMSVTFVTRLMVSRLVLSGQINKMIRWKWIRQQTIKIALSQAKRIDAKLHWYKIQQAHVRGSVKEDKHRRWRSFANNNSPHTKK